MLGGVNAKNRSSQYWRYKSFLAQSANDVQLVYMTTTLIDMINLYGYRLQEILTELVIFFSLQEHG